MFCWGGNMNSRALMWLAVLVAVSLVPAGAHHSITEVYDLSQTITIEGRVGRFLYQNPHAFVHLLVAGERGGSRIWAVEVEGPAKLREQGGSVKTLKPGDRITVCGNPGRDPGAYRVLMLTLERSSDGLSVTRSSASHSLSAPAPSLFHFLKRRAFLSSGC